MALRDTVKYFYFYLESEIYSFYNPKRLKCVGYVFPCQRSLFGSLEFIEDSGIDCECQSVLC